MKWDADYLFIGDIRVGVVTYDVLRPKGTAPRYVGKCLLPDSGQPGLYPTKQDAHAGVEFRVKHWLKRAGLWF